MTNTLSVNLYLYLTSGWTDSTSDVLSNSSINATWGMRSNRPTDRLADVGQLTFSLNNETGKYTPGSASVLSGWKKGTLVKVVFSFIGNTYTRFYGKVDSIKIDSGVAGNRRAHITALDWMDYAVKNPLNNPAIAEDQRADEALNTILNAMPIRPQVRDFDTGVNTFPMVFNNTTQKTKAYSEFQKLIMSEFGYLYHRKDATYGDTLVFEASNARPSDTPLKTISELVFLDFLLLEDGSFLLLQDGEKIYLDSAVTSNISIDNTMTGLDVEYGSNIINRISTTANPVKTDEDPSLIYELEAPIYVAAGASKTFNIQFIENSSKRIVAALSPTDSTYPQTLLHLDQSGVSSLITDEGGHTWYAIDSSIITTTKKIGIGSLYLDGSSSYIYSPYSSDYDFGSGDFTVEWWEYRFNSTSGPAAIARSGASGFVPWIFGQSDGTNSLIYISSNGSSWDVANGKTFGTISTNTWVSYAVTRQGTTFRAFKNGTITDSWTSSATIPTSTADFVIGKKSSSYITACIDEVRITKGLARYTASYTPTTDPFTISGVVYSAWTNSNSTGDDISDSFTITSTYGAAGATITVANSSVQNGYLTFFNIYSNIVDSANPITSVQEDTDSINEFGYYEETINQTYQQDLINGITESAAILAANKQPALILNKVTMKANTSDAMILTFLNTDIGDRVEIIEDQTGTNGSYYIQGMDFTAQSGAGGAVVDFSWIVKGS